MLVKTAAIFFACVLMISVHMHAQTKEDLVTLQKATPTERASMMNDLMKTKLMLSEVQCRQVAAVNLKYAIKVDPILKSDDSKFSKYFQIMPLMNAKDDELKKIFTPGQFTRYTAIKKELMDKAKAARDQSK